MDPRPGSSPAAAWDGEVGERGGADHWAYTILV